MINKKELNLLNELINRENLKGKERLKDFIWINTINPKYKIGDIVKFSHLGVYHYGTQPINWVGVITEINYNFGLGKNRERLVLYKVVYKSQLKNDNYKRENKNEITEHFAILKDDEIVSRCRIERVNIIENHKNNDSDYFNI